jgi:TonB-dependent siderophore receptor
MLHRSGCASGYRGVLATAISATLASVAHAAEDQPQVMKKVTVGAELETYQREDSSSSKYTQPLVETPQTVVVIPPEVISQRNATTLRDVLRNTPGITFQAGEGGGGLPGDQNFTMRGFTARNSVFVDGIRDAGSYTRDAFNLESVEVAKGPTGTIGGRSSSSGAINQISKTPHLEDSNGGTLGVGADNYRRVTTDINQALNDDMAFRLNLMYHDADVPDRDVVENERFGIAPSFTLGLGAASRLTLSYLYQEEDNVPDYGLPWVEITQGGVTYPTGAYNANPRVDQSNFYGLRNYDFEDLTTQVATVKFEHDFSANARIENITRWLDSDRNSAITAPRQAGRQLQRRAMTNENLTNQTNLVVSFNTGGLQHDLVTGLELATEETTSRNSAQATNQPGFDLHDPNPNDRPFGPMPPITGNPSKTELDSIAVYVFDTLTLNERWEVTGGVRWDEVDVDYELRSYETGQVTTRLDKSDGLLSWNTGIVFKPREDASIYLSYSSAKDPTVDAGAVGASLSDSPTSANNVNLDPEKSRHYELGTKWNLSDIGLSLTAAVFRTEKTNVCTRLTNNDPYVLSGEQRIDGLELGIAGNITERWSAFGGYAYLDSKIERSANPDEVDAALLQTPEHSISLWTTYVLPFDLTIGAGAQYIDEVVRSRTVTDSGVVNNILSSYWLVDAMASYPLTQSVTLRLNVTNLTDKFYVDRIGGGHYVPGPGRSASLTADIRF